MPVKINQKFAATYVLTKHGRMDIVEELLRRGDRIRFMDLYGELRAKGLFNNTSAFTTALKDLKTLDLIIREVGNGCSVYYRAGDGAEEALELYDELERFLKE
jgi:DNA-binding HxlR family transcriptional regulator